MDITPEMLKQMYVAEFLSIGKIAERVGRSKTYINKLLTAYNIPLRTRSDYKSTEPNPRVRTYGTGKCLCCGQQTQPNKANPKMFNKFCSKECQQKYETPKNLLSRDYLYEERIVKERSLEAIAKENKCTVNTVKRWLEHHSIPTIRLNESRQKVKDVLDNKDNLSEMYHGEGMTCEEIAEKIGSSRATVALSLHKNGIEVKPPNAYDREFKRVSAGEQEVLDFLKSIYTGEIQQCNRTLLNGLELDIYLPEKKLAIEFNGVFYHSEVTKEKDYHLKKTEKCAEQGIQLIHIFDTDWESRKPVWMNFLRNKVASDNRKVYARNCEVREVEASTKNHFLNENHLQGADSSRVKLGLYLGDELVALMTFGTPRYNKDFDWELIRFAVKGGVSVVGGFSKLLKHFRENHEGSIISYANRLYSEGKVYRVNGFNLFSTNPPRYFYFDSKHNEIIGRHNAVKANLLKRFPESERDELKRMSETEIAHLLGWAKVYDSGTYTFVA